MFQDFSGLEDLSDGSSMSQNGPSFLSFGATVNSTSFSLFFCEHYSSALIVIMSIEKFFALYFPLKTRSVCTVRTARWVSLGTVLIFIIFNTQAFFIYKAQNNSNGHYFCVHIRVPETYRLVFFRLNSVLYSFGPFCSNDNL